MAIYFLDNDQQLIKIVPDNGAISILQTQELPEDNSLLKDVLSVHLKNDERLFNAQYMAIKSYDGNRNSFDMYRIVNELVPDNATEFEGVQVAPYELEGVVVEDLRPQGWTIERTTNQILKDSDWRLGYVDGNLPTVTTNFYYLSAKDSLKKLQELTGVEFTFKVEISGNKITDKWVEVYRELGNRTLKRFNYGTNALTVKRETNHSELYTALIGRGKGEEVGETEAGDATYGRKINFADVEWKKSDGKPVNKPKGQKYIELPTATAEFGVKMLDGRKVPRIGLVEFPDTEDPEILINQTWQALQEYARPKVLFSATVANIGDTGIGDTVTIHRHDLNMHYKTRVRKVMRNRKNNDKTQVEIGDVVYTASTKRQANINSQLDNMQNDLSNVKGEVSHVVTSADGKNNITYSNIEPERKKVGDSWVRDHPSLAGETQWLVWNGEAWELILDTSETTLNKEAIEQAQQDITEAKQTADEAVEQIDTAVANAGFTSLDETINSVQSISNQAQINAGTAIDHSLEAIQQASIAVENTGSLNVRVDEVEDTLSIKADKQLVDDLTGVVDLQALDIQANAQGLVLKANQDTVDLLSGTVSSLGTEVSQVAGEISNKVWKTDIESAVDGLEIGGRNYFSPSKVENTAIRGSVTSGDIIGNSNYKSFYISVKKDEVWSLSRTEIGNANRFSYTFSTDEPLIGVEVSGGVDHRNDLKVEGIKIPFDGWLYIYLANNVSDAGSLPKIKLEKGTKATDWTPAPEDTDAKIEHIETEFTQTFERFDQTVSDIDGRVTAQTQEIDRITTTVADHTGRISTTERTVSGIQDTVYDPETGLTSLNTQLADLVQVAVTGEELSGALTVMEDNLNLRLVKKDEIITQINLSEENILIQANKIMALGDVVVDGKLTITDEFIAPNAQIDGAKIADATIGSAKIVNLDVDKISGNRTEFIQSYWNRINDKLSINGSELAIAADNGWRNTNLTKRGIEYWWKGESRAGAVGYFISHNDPNSAITGNDMGIYNDSQRHSIGIMANSAHTASIGYTDSTTSLNYYPAIEVIAGQQGDIVFHTAMKPSSDSVRKLKFEYREMLGQFGLVLETDNLGSGIFFTENGMWFKEQSGRWSRFTTRNIEYEGWYGNSNLQGKSSGNFEINANNNLIITNKTSEQAITIADNIDFYKPVNINGRTTYQMGDVYSNNGSIYNVNYNRVLGIGSNVDLYTNISMRGNNLLRVGTIDYESDKQLKEKIKDRHTDDLNTIMSIRYVDYRKIDNQQKQRGFIAQELQLIDRDLVIEDEDGILSYDGQGYVHTIGHAVQQLALKEENTNKIASQALQTTETNAQKINRLEKRIEELEGVM